MTMRAMNLGHLLTQAARCFPDRIAIISGEESWTWRQFNERVDRLAQALHEHGVDQGQRVLVQARNSHRLLEVKWACFKLGAVWVPVNFRSIAAETAYMAAHSDARAIFYDHEFEAHAQAAVREVKALKLRVCLDSEASRIAGAEMYEEFLARTRLEREVVVERDSPAWFFYTSGTTGRPKAAVLTHGQLSFVVANHLADMFPGASEEDTSLVMTPLSHGAGVHALSFVARGATQVIHTGAGIEPAGIWALVARHKVTNFFAVPTLLKKLVEDPAVDAFDHAALRFVNYGGAPMYRADQRRALDKLGKVLVQHYGLGEFTAAITVLPPDLHGRKEEESHVIGTCGRPRTGAEVAILDAQGNGLPPGAEGEICARGEAAFFGYHNDEQSTAAAFRGGWFHSGDLGFLDERGFLYITGRMTDMYISGGINIYPREMEEIILRDPRISEVAIVGMPHPVWGESGVAVVAAKPGSNLSSEDILAPLGAEVAKYKLPKAVIFWDELPKSGYGKILKREIRDRLARETAMTS